MHPSLAHSSSAQPIAPFSVTRPQIVVESRFFIQRLHREFAYATQHKALLSLIIFDIDNARGIADTYGRLASDSVLAQLAKTLAPMLRYEDTFTRYGGETFAILSRSTEPPSATVVAERVRQHVERHKFEYRGQAIAVTVNVGVAALPDPEIKAPEDLIARADLASRMGTHAAEGAMFSLQEWSELERAARMAGYSSASAWVRRVLLTASKNEPK